MTIGQTLKTLRLKKNYKQTYVAEQLLITQGYLSRIENDNNYPTIEVLHKFAQFYKVNPPLEYTITEQFRKKLNPEVN
jgi:transcriptional regulator with XRE-family HTH domain